MLLTFALVAVQFLIAPIAPHIAHASTSFVNKTTADGLGHNSVRRVFAIGSTVYAATAGGLSISHDAGNNFTNYTTAHGLGHNSVLDVYAIDGTPHDFVYAATEGGISISTDGGLTFTNRPVMGPYGARSVFAVPGTPHNAIYVGTSAGLEFSTDGGATWTQKYISDGLGGGYIEGVYAKAGNPYNTIYAATQHYAGGGSVSVSTDGGNTFTSSTSGLNRPSATRDVYVDANTIAVAEFGVTISTDGGNSFTNYTSANGLGSDSVYEVFAAGGNIYAATTGGLSVLPDGETRFTNYTNADGLGSTTTYGVHVDGSTIYVATSGGLSISSNPAPQPTFRSLRRMDDGFTVNVTNYDAAYTWTATVSAGSVSAGTASGSTLPLTVTGLSAGQSATLTMTVARTGYSDGSATVTGQAKSTQTVTWSPVTAISTASSTVTPSSLASGPVGGGAISYSVDSFTTTACSVDPASAVLTVSGTGDCVVRATAEATADYLEGSAVVTFSLSKAAQPVTWAPSTSLTLPGATVTPSVASVPAGGGAITYSVEDAGSTGCSVNSGTGALTYTGAGECVVRATAEATKAYVQGHTDVTFTISKATPTLTWNPDLVQVLPNTSTTFAAATTSSDGAITYAVTDAGTTSCSLPNNTSTALSFSADGSCEVTATVAGTTDYDEVTSVKTFAIYKSAQTITWSPSTSLDLASLSTGIGAASTSGDGAVNYSVTSGGGTGCAFADSSSPTLTYSAAGTCTVTATAASTVAYAQATESVIIRITKATPTMSWSPTTALVMPAATVSPSSSPSTTSDGTLSYAVVSDTGTNCTVNSSTGALTYTDTGICQVSASTASTTRYTTASTTVDFTVSLAPQTITAAAGSTSLRPRGTTTVSSSGTSGSGVITWTNTTPAVCTLTGTTVTADANGSCVLTVSIEPDATYAAASDSITIAVTTPPPPAGGGGSGGSGGGSGGPSGGGSSVSGGGSSSTASSGGSGSGSGGGSAGSGDAAQSQDDVAVPGTGSTTRGRSLPPPPQEVDIQPLRSGARSSVLIKQPVGTAGAQVLATVVVVRNAKGKIISRINIDLGPGQTQTRVTVPYVADGYTVDVYNVNEVGVSTGALTRSPLVRATTITKRTSSGQPRLFGEMLGKPIIFNRGSAVLDKKDKKQLRAIARQAMASNERLFVTGFARKGGGSASELASLSTKRARAAATYLSKRGVRVWIRYWGAGTLNGTGQASDRRVEVRTSAAPIPRSLVP